MIFPHLLRVLGALGEAEGSAMVQARREAHGRVPRALRAVVRTRVTRAVSDAIHTTSRGDDEPHVHRLAYLETLGVAVESPDDVDAVRAAFSKARSEAKERERPSTVRALALGLVMLAVPAALVTWWAWPRDPYAELADLTPASSGAYVDGGRPEPGTPAQRAVFETALPAFVIALDAERARRERGETGAPSAALAAAHAELVSASRSALGEEITSFFSAVLEQSTAIVASAGDDRGVAAESFVRSVDALDASVQAEGLGYYVDAEVVVDARSGARRVYLSTFTVEGVSIWRSGGTTVRALRLRRLDRLSFARSVLGFTRPHLRDALVMDEPIEEHLVAEIVPALVEAAPMRLVGARDWEGHAIAETAARAAGAVVRAEMRAVLGGDGNAGAELGALLTRRAELFGTTSERLEQSGLRLLAPEGYALDLARYEPLRPRLLPPEWRELETIRDALAESRHQRTFRALRARMRASVERHEVQHRLDFAWGAALEVPEALARYTGPVRVGDRESPGAARASAELSAYLSEVARDPEIARTNLALLSRHLFDRTRWGSAECWAALVIVETLAAELALTHDDLLRSHAIDRAEVTRVLAALFGLPGQALSDAATRGWARLHRRPLPELARSSGGADAWDEIDRE